jgi:hypothetical protein
MQCPEDCTKAVCEYNEYTGTAWKLQNASNVIYFEEIKKIKNLIKVYKYKSEKKITTDKK